VQEKLTSGDDSDSRSEIVLKCNYPNEDQLANDILHFLTLDLVAVFNMYRDDSIHSIRLQYTIQGMKNSVQGILDKIKDPSIKFKVELKAKEFVERCIDIVIKGGRELDIFSLQEENKERTYKQ
jgi:hypothetical protein